MSVNTQKYNAKRFLDAVIKAKKIHKYDLIDELHISESKYEKLKPYMEYKFGYTIFYDKKTKCWEWVMDEELTSNNQITPEVN